MSNRNKIYVEKVVYSTSGTEYTGRSNSKVSFTIGTIIVLGIVATLFGGLPLLLALPVIFMLGILGFLGASFIAGSALIFTGILALSGLGPLSLVFFVLYIISCCIWNVLIFHA